MASSSSPSAIAVNDEPDVVIMAGPEGPAAAVAVTTPSPILTIPPLPPPYRKFWINAPSSQSIPLLPPKRTADTLSLPVSAPAEPAIEQALSEDVINDSISSNTNNLTHQQQWKELWRQLRRLHHYSLLTDVAFLIGILASICIALALSSKLDLSYANGNGRDSTSKYIDFAILFGVIGAIFLVGYLVYARIKHAIQTSRQQVCQFHELLWLHEHYGMAVECNYEHWRQLYLYLLPIDVNKKETSADAAAATTTTTTGSWLLRRNGYVRIQAFSANPWSGSGGGGGWWTPVRLSQLATLTSLSSELPVDSGTSSHEIDTVWNDFWTYQWTGHWTRRLASYRWFVALGWTVLILLFVSELVLDWNSAIYFVLPLYFGGLGIMGEPPTPPLKNTPTEVALTQAGYYWEIRYGYDYSWFGMHAFEHVYIFPPTSTTSNASPEV